MGKTVPHLAIAAARASERQRIAALWVAEHPPDARVLVVAPSLEAGSRVLRLASEAGGAAFGWQRATLGELAARLASAGLARAGRTQVAPVVLEAVCARVVHRLRAEHALGRYASVGERPGLPRALARTFSELALAAVDPAHPSMPEDLARLHAAYRRELAEAGLADRADVLRAAIDRVRDPRPHPLLDMPTVLLDVPLASALEGEFVAALAARAPVRAVAPLGDSSLARLERALGVVATVHRTDRARHAAIDRLCTQLFSRVTEGAPLDESVELFSAPGESRECVEIARRVLRLASDGWPFDRMAVLTHAPDRYRAHLEEALRRAGVPAYFSRGVVRPDPAGRALLALLACKEERLSARAFAEYLSLGVVPDVDEDGAPPRATASVAWLAPEDELSPVPDTGEHGDDEETDSDAWHTDAPVVRGTLRAPWRWERLIVDAAVIGGADRWRRRLEGLAHSLEARAAALEDPDDPAHRRIARERRDLEHLTAFALPLLELLDALPSRATWGEWGEHLAVLAQRAIRDPARVLAVLRELAPMGPIGPVGLTEVALVLRRRLSEMVRAPTGSPAGKVYVASIQEARGLAFDVVFVPGLAERVFPKKVIEDPIALDSVRRALSSELATTESRVADERLALRLAVGAATRRVVLSYPRLDTERGRPRVPSFYALEVLRAIEGTLPSFEELANRAEEAGAARMAWPAPARCEDAIDGAEYDLAVLHEVLHERTLEQARGAGRYLMSANPHLARALRARFARWDERWMRADGFVNPSEAARALLAAHHPRERPYSATALEQLAACPYRFYLRAIVRLAPRDVPESIEELHPRERGSMIHEAQALVLTRLRERGLLPVTDLAAARAIASEVVDEVEARYRERLAPAIERVWRDAVDEVRGDLAEWLLRMAERPEWKPVAFELAFGIPIETSHDSASVAEPIRVAEGLTLRGAIDLVEERTDGVLRATDHKTGAPSSSPRVIAGGRVLQPVLYASALEALFPGREVAGGRLHYCTSRGRFEERFVPLDDAARDAIALVRDTLAHHIEAGFLPAAPSEGECERCDYRPVCGPVEERRVRRKHAAKLGKLKTLRSTP